MWYHALGRYCTDDYINSCHYCFYFHYHLLEVVINIFPPKNISLEYKETVDGLISELKIKYNLV